MIPRIAWFHWDGELSWLREQSVRTFKKHNPEWDVRLVQSPPEIEGRGYDPWHSGDWTKWRMLAHHGGFSVDTDTITLAPIPEEWLDYDLCAQVDSFGNVEQMAIIGATAGNPLFVKADERCATTAQRYKDSVPRSYQSFGVELLRRITDGRIYDHKSEPGRFGLVGEIQRTAYCFYDFVDDPISLWREDGPTHKPLPDDVLGVHWYGGHGESKKHEPTSGPGGTSWLERLATGV